MYSHLEKVIPPTRKGNQMAVVIEEGKYFTKSNLKEELGLTTGQLDFVLQKEKILGLKIGNTTIFNQDQFVEVAKGRSSIRKAHP